jgi:hypothetical protein
VAISTSSTANGHLGYLLPEEAIEMEPTGAEVGGSALVLYTNVSSSSQERPTRATLTRQRVPVLYIPPSIKPSFLFLARYVRLGCWVDMAVKLNQSRVRFFDIHTRIV